MTHDERLPQCDEKFHALDLEMVDAKKPKGNGLGILLKMIGILLAVMSPTVGYIIANDSSSRSRDTEITKDHQEDVDTIKEDFNAAILKQTEMNGKIFGAITRIETLLSTENITTARSRTDAAERYKEERRSTQ